MHGLEGAQKKSGPMQTQKKEQLAWCGNPMPHADSPLLVEQGCRHDKSQITKSCKGIHIE